MSAAAELKLILAALVVAEAAEEEAWPEEVTQEIPVETMRDVVSGSVRR